MVQLGVNVDHVATIRQARFTEYPDPVAAAKLAKKGGADQITIHLREDRRHIQDMDLVRMRSEIDLPLNLEMGATREIVGIACEVKPDTVTLVPERREELTTEGGLDVVTHFEQLRGMIGTLTGAGIEVSLFIDPDIQQIDVGRELGAQAVELHTGAWCDAKEEKIANEELARLVKAARHASGAGFTVCAGHGISYENAKPLAKALPEVLEYNIGHAIVARALFVGMEAAVREMKKLLKPSS